MATMADAIQPEDRADWEINKDAFAPPPTRRLVRGWDRAPVSAHAPRLQGQKVWKKFRALPGKAGDDGMEAQDELEKEGAGQRKKARPMGAKENIMYAGWSASRPQEEEDSGSRPAFAISPMPSALADVTNLQTTPVSSKVSISSTMPELHFIPRKRTNTNHVITPKKPMRQTTLNRQAQRDSILDSLNADTGKRPRKSMRKSMRLSSFGVPAEPPIAIPQSQIFTGVEIQAIETDKQFHVEEGCHTALEDIPRRKSARQSTRSTRASVVPTEQITGQITEPGTTATEEEVVPELLIQAVAHQDPRSVEEEPTVLMDDAVASGGEIGLQAEKTDLQDRLVSNENEELDSGSTDSSLSSIESGLFDDIPQSHSKIESDTNQASQQDEQANSTDTISTEQVDALEITATRSSERSPDPRQAIDNAGDPVGNFDEFVANEAKASPQEIVVSGHPEYEFDIGEPSVGSTKAEGRELINIDVDDFFKLAPVGEEAVDVHTEKVATTDAADTSASVGSSYDHDDTDMLLSFLTRVKANKAAKRTSPRRKRSLPHSPLRIPLGDMGNNLSPLSLQQDGEFDLAPASPSKRKKRRTPVVVEEEVEEEKSYRRSTRTRLPVKSGAQPLAPSLIPMRRLGQEDATVTLKRSEEKELAALTRVNTRKNKGGSLPALEVLSRKVEEKDDPVMRQRLLKEVFDAKIEKGKEKKVKGKGVTWAEELAQFQTLTKGSVESKKEVKEREKSSQPGEEKKQSAVRVGVRSKMALGMAANGTPAPKRKAKSRA